MYAVGLCGMRTFCTECNHFHVSTTAAITEHSW